jgi:hypothetical protein
MWPAAFAASVAVVCLSGLRALSLILAARAAAKDEARALVSVELSRLGDIERRLADVEYRSMKR